jgi:glycosyltransferase involved in cell wall biosynthesis
MKKKVSILVPAYNEALSLTPLYERLAKAMDSNPAYEWEILFVNDGSADDTLSVIKILQQRDSRVNYLDLSRNFGKEAAMLAGFDYVTGNCTVILDADLQHPPELIAEMLNHWEKGYDDVYAKRTSRGNESPLRKRFSMLYYKILQKSTRIDVLENAGDFRLLDEKCIDILRTMRESERYTKGMFSWIGFRKKEILFEQHDRCAGCSSWSFKSLFNLAVNGIVSFTVAPLRFSTIVGFAVSLAAFFYIAVIVVKTIVWGEPVTGYPTLMVTMLFLGGIQLVAIGIIGEYLGRIFHETKRRPPYIVREHNGAASCRRIGESANRQQHDTTQL